MREKTNIEFLDIQQGTPHWLALRKTKITATDAPIIMGASHWKTRIQLYQEKTSDVLFTSSSARMQRGIDLEPIARELFSLQTGFEVYPKVIVKDWAMASLDGISKDCRCVVEIKCPGEKDHSIAMSGKVPDHYYPQLQHQIHLSEVDEMYYFSFDGIDGVSVKVKRDDAYISKMVEEEKRFMSALSIKRLQSHPKVTT